MDVRNANMKMVNSATGSWSVAAAYLGMSETALRNRVYESKGQVLRTHDSLRLQELSQTTLFAEAVANESGGVFVAMPDIDQISNENIQSKFNETYAELGLLFSTFSKAVEDGVIDTAERGDIETIGNDMHKKVEALMALMFGAYCRKSNTVKLQPLGRNK